MSVGGSNLPVKGISIFDELLNDVRTLGRTGQLSNWWNVENNYDLKVLIANQARDYKNSQGIINEDKQVLAFRAH